MHLGFILTRSPHASDADSISLKAALAALDKGDSVSIFLLGDSVWLASKPNVVVENFIKRGGKLIASGEHIRANGLSQGRLASGAEIADETYETLVDLVMEKFDRVVII